MTVPSGLSSATLLLVTLLCNVSPAVAQGHRTDEETRLARAFELLRNGDLDAAASIYKDVDAADTNYWREMYGLAPAHWIAQDYLAAIERIRAGDAVDQFFQSRRFRFHARGLRLNANERERIVATFEDVLEKVAHWAGEASWQGDDHRIVFVQLAESFPTPSPARTLIFFWDRQDRAPRMEFTRRALHPDFLEQILAHELTHVVLPHTSRPLAEGMANLAAREIFPDRPNPIRSRAPPDPEPWPVEEVLLFNVRAEGQKARRQVELLVSGGFSPEAVELTALMYKFGDKFVRMVLDVWGRKHLMEVYRATNRDPASIDVIETAAEHLGPIGELQRMWEEWLAGVPIPPDDLSYRWIPPGSNSRGDTASVGPGGFWMSTYEVPVEAFRRFVLRTGYVSVAEREGVGGVLTRTSWENQEGANWHSPGFPQTDRHPVVLVAWEDADAFCRWTGGRLPTGSEWAYAARGGMPSVTYVWGEAAVPLVDGRKYANVADEAAGGISVPRFEVPYEDGAAYTAPVGSYEPNGFGLHDMAGNVLEWTADSAGPDHRTARGGAWNNPPEFVRISRHSRFPASAALNILGFRCVREAD